MSNSTELPSDRPPTSRTGQHGSNLLGVGQYNERLILQLIRRAGSLPKAEIARQTRLSAQTVSVIINRLLREKLVLKRPRHREKGKVGQPAVPITLNPEGAYSIGIKIGRRSVDVLIIDFVGQVLERRNHPYSYPDPDRVFPAIDRSIVELTETLSVTQRNRIVGIGIAAPYSLGGWQQETGAPGEVLARWNDIDIRQQVRDRQQLPVWFANDATAACIAELEFGSTRLLNYLYIFLGTFIGGGVVLNGTLHAGSYDNAGALGSMPVPVAYADSEPSNGQVCTQLINCASRYLLERRLQAAGFEPESVIEALGSDQDRAVPVVAAEIFADWFDKTAAAIAFAVTAAASVIDFEGAVIDGAFPASLVDRLVRAVDSHLETMDLEGLIRPRIHGGAIGNDARALGGAILPLYASFAPDRDVLLKLGVESVS